MTFSIDRHERYAVLNIGEENINSAIAPDLKAQFVQMAKDEVENLILDLSGVKYIDSSGLSAILTADRIWKGLKGSFVITGVESPSIQKLIEISRLHSVLTILPTISESVDFIFMEALERELNADPELE